MAVLFDRYVIVDWSASSSASVGKDSVWIAVLDADGSVTTSNQPTRGRAEAFLRSLLVRLVANRERVLVGFDFPYGYPDGFAAAMDLSGPAWRATWQLLAEKIRDSPESNDNNRFQVAAELNARVSGHLFWGRPSADQLADLSYRRDRVVYRTSGDARGVLEWRAAESVLRGGGQHPQPVWKLFGNGSVGSQSLMGIPVLARLRNDPALAAVSMVWPFEVSVPALPAGVSAIIHAEVWPSMIEIPTVAGHVKDEIQVMTLAANYRNRDRAGALTDAFAAVPSRARAEEGWILGVGVHAAAGEYDRAAGAGLPIAPTRGSSLGSTASDGSREHQTHPQRTSASNDPMDLTKAQQFIADVPVGRWTAYKDVAIAAGNARGAQRIGQWLDQSRGTIPGYWRVLTVRGRVPDGLAGGEAGPIDAIETRELLRQEGVQIDASGKASPAQRFSVDDWTACSRQPPV